MNDAAVSVDVWSDVACPWCFVGKRNLEKALASYKSPVEVRWHAFELNPQAPRSPKGTLSYAARLARKYQVSEDRAQEMVDRMTAVGASVGIDFRFDRIVPTNTFDTHRLIAWAGSTSGLEAAARLKERCLVAYMSEGARLGDPETLVRLAVEIGLDEDHARTTVAGEAYAAEVREDENRAYQMGIQGVPFFVLAGRIPLGGAQPPEAILEALGALREASPEAQQ